MLIDTTGKRKTSGIALRCLAGAVLVTALLAIPHGIFQGWVYDGRDNRAAAEMLATFTGDTRYLFENLIYVAAFVFVGAKFFETRTTFAVTFDRLDAAKVSMRGPDENNVVWIGQRYGTRQEAEAVAATMENRLKENAA